MFRHHSAIGVKRASKSKATKANTGRGVRYQAHTINVPTSADGRALNERIARTMVLEGITNFTVWANSAFTQRCKETESKNGVDAIGNPVPRSNP